MGAEFSLGKEHASVKDAVKLCYLKAAIRAKARVRIEFQVRRWEAVDAEAERRRGDASTSIHPLAKLAMNRIERW